MYVSFDQLTGQSRVWIYQANREFTLDEEKVILDAARSFCEQWSAHGAPLKTSCKLDHRQFLILAADEGFNQASGCSIDGSVQVLKSLQNQLGLDFFDRSSVAFLKDGKVKLLSVKELKQCFGSGALSAGSLAFNTQVTSKEELEGSWIIPVSKTWMARFLRDPAIV